MAPTLPYAMPNATNLLDLFIYANTITENFFGTMLLFAVWVVMFMALANQGAQKSLTGASFITVLIGALLWSAGVVGAVPMIAAILALVASAMYLFIAQPSGY